MTTSSSPMFTVEQILASTGGYLFAGDLRNGFSRIVTDSRQVQRGDLFVALKGEKYDGHNFSQQALDDGAAGILVEEKTEIDLKDGGQQKNIICVKSTLQALGDLAHDYRRRFSFPIIGLTGSSGKTSTKEIMAAVAGRKKNILATEGNFNNLIGLPLTIFRLNQSHELAILEMGMNIRGEIKRMTQIAAPDIGLITNIGPAHLAGLGSLENIREEKGDLFFNMSPAATAVVNVDDEAVRHVAARWDGRRVTFGFGLDAEVTAKNIEKKGFRGVCFDLVIGDKVNKVEMKIAGIHHVYNALAAAASVWAAGFDCPSIVEGLASFRPVSGRMQMIKLANGAYIIDDTYNANPASVREALLTLKDLKKNHNGFVFLGDMLELGEAADKMHRKIGTLIATIGANAAFLKGEFSEATADGAKDGGLSKENIFSLADNDEYLSYLRGHLKKGDWILVKGSRRMNMEKIVEKILTEFGMDENTKGNRK